MRYSIEPRDRIFVKGYRFLSFVENMRNKLGKNIKVSKSSRQNNSESGTEIAKERYIFPEE